MLKTQGRRGRSERGPGARPGLLRAGGATVAALAAVPLLVVPGGGPAAGADLDRPAGVAGPAGPAGAAVQARQVPVYQVVGEGLTPQGAAQLADRAGIGNALRPDGSFAFTDPERYGRVPSKVAGRGVDENRRPTVSRAVDFEALENIQLPSQESAIESARSLLSLPEAYGATPVAGHTTVEQSDRKGRLVRSAHLDTTVSFRLDLGGLPLVGAGAKAKVSFGPGGVVALSRSVREVSQGGSVAVIDPKAALARCTALYPRGTRHRAPVLAYYSPPLTARQAGGEGAVKVLAPHYVCRPVVAGRPETATDPQLTGRLVPAAPALTPRVQATARSDGKAVRASIIVQGGTAPYQVKWASSSTILGLQGPSVTYRLAARRPARAETLTATVTDANGVASTATLRLGLPGRPAAVKATGGAGGLGGAFASVGIEQTVDEWQCAQDSANGFKHAMRSRGNTVEFDWRGHSAFEKDFKRSSLSGWDNRYVDSVDAQWYTGHGSAGGFTFKSSVSDTSIVPSDARWGDGDLEWMQLESCQVLRDTNGANDYFARWGQVFSGLHLLNGFDTNAYCVDGGTGRRFADYLFPEKFLWWTTRPALTVQQAWARMADDLEPAGVRWRTISAAGPGWVTNLDDHFWGQGSVGPDIRGSQLIGWVAVSGLS